MKDYVRAMSITWFEILYSRDDHHQLEGVIPLDELFNLKNRGNEHQIVQYVGPN